MPSSLLELTNQLGVNSEPPEQVAASGGSDTRSIILTFPGLPSCCMEITINFEDDNGSDSKGTQSEEVDMRLPTQDFSAKTQEELAQPCQFTTCEDGLAHELDQSTVYIGLDSGLTAGRKKARKKTESLVRTLPILAQCSKRWLNFRGRKGHERGRICAFESGDVGKITSSSTSVDDGNDSPRHKLDTKQGFVSSKTPLTFLNSMTTFSKSSSHDRKKSLERSHDPRAVKYSSRKSKSGVGISEMKPETLHGEEVDAGSPKQKSDPSMNQLKVNNLPQPTRSKHNPQVDFNLSDSHEKVKKHGGGKYSETNKDRCKVANAKETDHLPEGDPQMLSKPSCLSSSMHSQSSSKLDPKSVSHKALDTMFVDVIKMLVTQEDPQNAKRSSSLAEQQENYTLQADPLEISTRQQMNEYHAFGNNKSRTSDQGSMWEDRKPQENVLGGSISRNGLPRCNVSGLNFPLRSNSYVRNISCSKNVHCDRKISCDQIERSERNIRWDRNMSYGKIQDCARNVSCDRNMGYDKNKDCISKISCERSKSLERNNPCDIYISSDGYISCDRKTSCAGNINCDKHISCGRKITCDGNISCERKYRLQQQTTKGNSNNCHLCCSGEVSECNDFIAVFDSASSSDDSLRGSFGSSEDLLSSEGTKLGPREEGSKSSKVLEMGRSLQGRLQNAADDNQTGGTSRNSDQYREKLAVPVFSGPTEADHSSSQENLCGLQHHEQSSGASVWDDPKDELSNSVATKAESNAESFENAKYVFKSGNYCTRKDKDDSTCSHVSIHRGIAKALYDSKNVDSAACANNCSRASSCHQCNDRRRIAKEEEDGNESQLRVVEGCSLPKENGSHKSVRKYDVVAVKSSKLHKIFSKSSGNTRHAEGRLSDCDYTSRANKNPGDVQLTSGNLGETMSSTSVNLDSEDEEFRLVEREKPKENGGSVALPTAGSTNAKVTSRLGRFISSEKRKCRVSLTSSFFGKAKTALSCVRSRSSSPAVLGTKIKNMFFRESVDRILSKNSTAIQETEKDTSQRPGSDQENSSRQHAGSKQAAVSKDRVDLKLVVRSTKKAKVTVIPKELGSTYCSTDLDGSIAKEYCKPLIETQTSGQDLLQLDEKDKVKHVFSRSEASTSQGDKTKPARCQSPADSTSIGINKATLSAAVRPESARFDNPTSDIVLSVDLRRKITQYLDGQFKMAPQILPTTSPVTVIIPPSLEAIAEAESPSEDSTVDEEMAQIKCESFTGRDNLTKVNISKGATLENDDGLRAVSTSSSVRSNQTCGRKLDLRMSSSFEDCTRDFGVVSLGNNVLKPAPMRTHSWLSTFEAAQTELQAISGMAIISRDVKIMRYPSFLNLTDINDEGVHVAPVNTSGSNDCIVSKDTSGENLHLVQKNDEIRLTESVNLGSFPTHTTNQLCTINPPPTSATDPLSTDAADHLSTDAVDHLSTDAANILCPNTTNQNFTKTINDDSASKATKGHARKTTIQLAADTTNQIFANATGVSTTQAKNQLSTNTTNYLSTNTTNYLSINTTNQLSTNTTNQLSTNTTKQLSTNTTNQLFTNTTNQLSTSTTNQLSTNTTNEPWTEITNQLCTDTTNQLLTNTTNQLLTNTTNQLSTNTTNQLLTNTTNQLSANKTNQLSSNTTDQLCTYTTNELSTNTTKQLSTNTTNQLSSNTTNQLCTDTTNQLSTNTTNQISKKDPRMICSSLTDPDTKITLRETREAIVPSSLSYTNHAQPPYFTHLQTPFLLVANNLSFAESVDISATEEGDISSTGREIATPGSFIKPDGVGKESFSCAEVEQESTDRDEEVVDTCNSCLSDVESEDKPAGNDKCSIDEKTSKNDSASSITKTANKRKKVKTYNNKYALTASNYKTIQVKSETVLAESANRKTSKRSSLSSITDFAKRDSKGSKERSKNMNNAASGLFDVRDDTIDVDTTSFRSFGGSSLFVVTSTSSIFGAPDKRTASGLKSIKSPTKRSLVTNQILKQEPEETDDEDSDTLINTGLDPKQDSNIEVGSKVDTKSCWDTFENGTPIIDSQTQTGQMIDTIRMNETDENAQSVLNSLLNSKSSCINLGHSSLDITLCRDYALEKAPQMNFGNSSHQNLGRTKLPLLRTSSCYNCACHKTPSAFPAQNFLSRTMSKKLADRTAWSSRTSTTKEDFTSRAQCQLQRCDKVLQRSTGVINRSQEMSFRAHRQMEHTAEKLKLLKKADSRGPE